MKLRIHGQHLSKVLYTRIPMPLILVARTVQSTMLLMGAGLAAALGGFMWLIGMPPQFGFGLSLLCLGAWATTPAFAELLIGMSMPQEIAIAHFAVAAAITTAVNFVLASLLMAFLGDVVPSFYLAAAVTGACAPPLLMGYSLWYCRNRLRTLMPE